MMTLRASVDLEKPLWTWKRWTADFPKNPHINSLCRHMLYVINFSFFGHFQVDISPTVVLVRLVANQILGTF